MSIGNDTTTNKPNDKNTDKSKQKKTNRQELLYFHHETSSVSFESPVGSSCVFSYESSYESSYMSSAIYSKQTVPSKTNSNSNKTTSCFFYQNIKKHKILTAEEEKTYSTQAKQGLKEAVDKMVNCNQRLVTKIALRYIGRGIDLEDLIGEGNIGLMKSVKMFDPTRGFKFSTYATWWIRCFIERAIMNNSRTVRIPIHAVKKITKYLKTVIKLKRKLQRNPTLKEVARTLQWKIQKVSDTALINDCTISADTSGNNSGSEENNLYNFLESNASTPVNEELISNFKKILYSGLRTLTKKEQDVLLKRFGICGDKPQNLREIGEAYGICREMVRRHQTSALCKLRDYFDRKGIIAEDVLPD
jgi:RNA polymerase nonessential primary-like sigma factor